MIDIDLEDIAALKAAAGEQVNDILVAQELFGVTLRPYRAHRTARAPRPPPPLPPSILGHPVQPWPSA
ncbi:hypothetical protein BST61_g9174 [Cercospora zeina]